MIIRIEDAPNIKNIKIDINFDDVDGISVSSTTNTTSTPSTPSTEVNNPEDDILLNIDESYPEETKEVVEIPVVPDTNREVKVSEDMVNAEF